MNGLLVMMWRRAARAFSHANSGSGSSRVVRMPRTFGARIVVRIHYCVGAAR
jgi:hypothetical protein